MTNRHHAGQDADDPSLADVLDESDHADAVMAGEFETGEPGAEHHAIEDEGLSVCRWCQTEHANQSAEASHMCPDRREWLVSQVDHDDALIDPQTHEFGAKLLFHEHGMSPYWAVVSQFDRCMDDGDGDDVGSFEAAGDVWRLNHDEEKVKYWESGLAPPPENEHIDGGLNEYQINVLAESGDESGVEERKINFRFKPAFPNATHYETGEEIQSLPSGLPEGVRVEVDSSNIEFDRILDVLQALARELDINVDYFGPAALHGWSRVYNLGIYVRLRRSVGEDQIVALDTGLLDRMYDFGHRHRGRGEIKWDNEEVLGHRTAIALCAHTRGKFAVEAHVGALAKYYHPKHPRSDGQEDDPLYHPKFEIQYSTEYSDQGAIPLDTDLPSPTADGDETISDSDGPVPADYDFSSLYAELDGWLVNCLHWADVPVRADPQTYVADAYWAPTESERDIALVEDPMPTIREREERLAEYHVLQADATPSQQDVLAAATDGGRQGIGEVAAKAGVSERTVRRAAQVFDPILEVDNGDVGAADGVIREKINQLLTTVEDAAEWAKGSIEDALADHDKTISADSAFAKWMRTYGVNFVDGGGEREIAVHVGHYSLVEIRQLLREGLRAARETGHNTHDLLLDATASWYNEHGERESAINPFAIQGNTIAVLGAPLATIG